MCEIRDRHKTLASADPRLQADYRREGDTLVFPHTQVKSSFRGKGMAARLVQASPELGETHYAEHREKPFFGELVDFITSAPTLAFVLEGEGAIATARRTIGATNPADADPGSLRGEFALAMPNNLVHGSDSPESAEREIALWFPDGLV